MTDDIKLHPVPRVLLRDLSEIRARDELLAALKRIADGQEMSGTYTFGDVVLRYQEIARAAIASATGEQQP